MQFRVGTQLGKGKPMVEVWQDGKFIAGIHTHDDGLRIVSDHLDGVQHETGLPPALVVKLSDGL